MNEDNVLQCSLDILGNNELARRHKDKKYGGNFTATFSLVQSYEMHSVIIW